MLSVIASAQITKTINVTAGSLSFALTDEEKQTVTHLIMKGSIDARDFNVLSQMPSLKILDISTVSISKFEINDMNSIPFQAFKFCSNLKKKICQIKLRQ